MSDNNVRIYELHGRTYELHKLPATKGIVLLTRLTRLFGDAFMRLLVGGATTAKSETTSIAQTDALDAMVAKLQVFERLKDDDILDLCRMIFPYVLFGNERLYKANDTDIDMKFGNGYELDVWPVLLEAVRHNLGPLLEGFRTRFPAVLSETPTVGLRQ